ncbi:hypothetical protein N9M16_01840 [Candidatus Dependentiae bacterium]|nr:hypothetical protein [Candidatus Dependentiae bacterium]
MFKNECPGVLFGRPRRRPRREFAEHDAGSVSMADVSSHAEFRGRASSLRSGSDYSI